MAGIDLDIITHTCVCSSNVWVLDWVMFEDFEISAYSLTMHCANCDNIAITPTPIDKPGYGQDNVTV